MLVDLNTNTVAFHGESREIRPPQLIEFIYILHHAWPRSVSYELIGDLLWGMADDGRTASQRRQHLSTLASWARCVMGEFGVDVEAVAGRGYRLVLPRQPLATAAGIDRRAVTA